MQNTPATSQIYTLARTGVRVCWFFVLRVLIAYMFCLLLCVQTFVRTSAPYNTVSHNTCLCCRVAAKTRCCFHTKPTTAQFRPLTSLLLPLRLRLVNSHRPAHHHRTGRSHQQPHQCHPKYRNFSSLAARNSVHHSLECRIIIWHQRKAAATVVLPCWFSLMGLCTCCMFGVSVCVLCLTFSAWVLYGSRRPPHTGITYGKYLSNAYPRCWDESSCVSLRTDTIEYVSAGAQKRLQGYRLVIFVPACLCLCLVVCVCLVCALSSHNYVRPVGRCRTGRPGINCLRLCLVFVRVRVNTPFYVCTPRNVRSCVFVCDIRYSRVARSCCSFALLRVVSHVSVSNVCKMVTRQTNTSAHSNNIVMSLSQLHTFPVDIPRPDTVPDSQLQTLRNYTGVFIYTVQCKCM